MILQLSAAVAVVVVQMLAEGLAVVFLVKTAVSHGSSKTIRGLDDLVAWLKTVAFNVLPAVSGLLLMMLAAQTMICRRRVCGLGNKAWAIRLGMITTCERHM